MNHAILAFEPSALHRGEIVNHFAQHSLLPLLVTVGSDLQNCHGVDASGSPFPTKCECQQNTTCAMLVGVGLSAADHDVPLPLAGAHASVNMHSFGGQVFWRGSEVEDVQLRRGSDIV